jgi:hypothetical protein
MSKNSNLRAEPLVPARSGFTRNHSKYFSQQLLRKERWYWFARKTSFWVLRHLPILQNLPPDVANLIIKLFNCATPGRFLDRPNVS